MAISHEGWDPELFVAPPNEDDLCNICCQVLEDAVETSCGHSFCEKCIKGWLVQRQVCPQDQKALTLEECRPMVRDRRRILDMKVKCPWCSIQMELRSLTEHKKAKCQKRPEDAEDDDKEEPVAEKEKEENEYVIEFVDDQKENKKAEEEKKAKEAEQRDHLFAAQMQDQERSQRGLSLGVSARQGPGSPSRGSVAPYQQQQRAITPQVQLVRPMDQGEPHVEEFGDGNGGGGGGVVIEYYQADEFEGVEGQNGRAAKKPRNKPIPAKRSGCCGCSDRCWCCMCCFFWIILLVLGVSIWLWGPSGAAGKIGL